MLSDLLCSIFSSVKGESLANFLDIPFSSKVYEFIKSWQLHVLGVQIIMLTLEEPLRFLDFSLTRRNLINHPKSLPFHPSPHFTEERNCVKGVTSAASLCDLNSKGFGIFLIYKMGTTVLTHHGAVERIK